MKKVLFCLAFQLAGLVSLHSQHLAGYLGRQWILNGNLETFLRIKPAAKDPAPPINLKLGVGVEYVLTRYSSIGFEYQQFRTGFSTDLPYLPSYAIYNYDYGYNNSYLSYSAVTLGCQVQTYGITYTLYNRERALAPYGRYQGFGAKYISITEKDTRGELAKFAQDHGYTLTDPAQVSNAAGLTYFIGKKWIYFDRLLVDVRLQMCLVIDLNDSNFLMPGILLGDEAFDGDETSSNSATANDFKVPMERDMVKRVGQNSLFDLHVGVGWLLF